MPLKLFKEALCLVSALLAEKRETTRKEDAAYSLLGIFDIHMPLIYGEGREKAFIRLKKEIDDTSNSKSPLLEL